MHGTSDSGFAWRRTVIAVDNPGVMNNSG